MCWGGENSVPSRELPCKSEPRLKLCSLVGSQNHTSQAPLRIKCPGSHTMAPHHQRYPATR